LEIETKKKEKMKKDREMKQTPELGTVMHTLALGRVREKGSWVQGQPGLHRDPFSKNK
jgi:hypothetical protein